MSIGVVHRLRDKDAQYTRRHSMGDRMEKSEALYGRFAQNGRVFVGAVHGQEVQELDATSMTDIILGDRTPTPRRHRLRELKVLAPIEKPSKIVCVGLNYRSHIEEMNASVPREPIIFSKPSSAVIGPEEEIVLPRISSRVDFEGESAIVIGCRAKKVTAGLEFIFGYTCLNDVTARDLQAKDVDWTRAKGFDTFAPMGPFISTKPPTRVVTRLNGVKVQEAPLSERVFDDAALVEYISDIMTLEPGDVIATGTPAGIAPMSEGDIVEVELDSVGILRNQVVRR